MKNKKLNILLVLLLISLSFSLLICVVIESDYLWHIKAGEAMFKSGILTHDIFSWFLSGKYWMSHEWLFEIIIYGLKLVFGSIHSIIYCFVCLCSLFLIIFFSNKKNMIKNIPFTLLFLLMFSLLSFGYIQVRPHMISFIFITLFIYFLYDLYKNKDSKKIYFLPLVAVLWSNVHGGSSNLSYLLCLLFFIGGLFSFNFNKIEAKRLDKKQLQKYLIVMFLCMISVCINVHGFKMFIYPYENMLDTTMISSIVEWQSTSLNEWYHYTYFIFIIIMVLVMLFSDKKIEFIDFLLLGFCTYLGLKSIRFWLYSPIIMSYVIFNYVNNRKLDKGTYGVIGLISISLFGVFIYNFKNITDIKYSVNLNKDIIDIIKRENPKRLFNMYNYGGELIYNDIKVFIDGRADLYSKYNYKDALNISNLNEDYVKLINKYDFDYFLVSKDYSINTYLKYNDDYEVIYQNKELSLYKKIVN